jgi:hypothetical protein
MRRALRGTPLSTIVTRSSSRRKTELPTTGTCTISGVIRAGRTALII